MKHYSSLVLGTLLCAAICTIGATTSTALVTPYVTQSGGTPRADTFPQAGWGFYISGPVEINYLGFWDEGGDGLAVAHDVGLYLWNYSANNANLIAKATIPAGTGALLENGFRWVSIPTLTLTDTTAGGATYQVLGSQNGADTWYDGGVSVVTPAFGTLIDFVGIYNGTPMGEVGGPPAQNAAGSLPFGGANIGFAAIPEPTSVVLTLAGLGLFGLIRRKR